jgi:asparagine synthase (glutamine-hydrolysing)
MCGIFGIFRAGSPLTTEEQGWMRDAQAALRHRGPDGSGVESFLGGQCALGHTRLAIIDVEGGAQPLFNEDRTIAVICNGEIYNHVELRQQLESRGHHFRTHSDCEVLVHLYEERGEELLAELEGMYAFALLDARNRLLLLARDRFGEKPLYWTETDDRKGLAFASELKALRELPGVAREMDVAGIAQFLALRYIPAPRTLYRGVCKLKAGEKLVFSSAGVRRQKYSELVFPERDPEGAGSAEEAVEQVWEKLRQAVRLRLRSDVPVGAFLSGGIDSTSIVCAMRDLEPGARLHTFCASFDEASMDEAPYARVVAKELATEHIEVRFAERELLDVLTDVVDQFDEPFADASMLPTYAVCRAARQQCKVMLSGDGGDEFFAGYRNFFQHYRWHGVRRVRPARWLARAITAVRRSGRGTNTFKFLGSTDRELFWLDYDREKILQCFAPEEGPAVLEGLLELEKGFGYHERLGYPRSLMEAVANGYLPEQILVKVDRASMMSSLESRAPFLDRALVECALKLPLRYNLARGLGKAMLRRALPAWVPPAIRWGEKRGFTPPIAAWLRTALRSQMTAILEDSRAYGSFCLGPARQAFREHLAGADHADYLFRWFVLLRSCARFESRANPAGVRVSQ